MLVLVRGLWRALRDKSVLQEILFLCEALGVIGPSTMLCDLVA